MSPINPPSPEINPAIVFDALDDGLPLALFPVRLEARFLPDQGPSEIVVRIFPDEIHADAHDPALTATELELAFRYWESIWRAAGAAQATLEAREWLAGQLGPYRAVYVAWVTRPAGNPPPKPVPEGALLNPPLKLRDVPRRTQSRPGLARLLPARWVAFVETGEDRRGPFWAAQPVSGDLAVTPALVELGKDAAAREFLDAQGLSWTHDLTAAENAGMLIRIPLSALPDRPAAGYDRLVVLGVAVGAGHSDALAKLLDAHRYTRGLDLIAPGAATNVTGQSPEGAGEVSVDALFESEFDRPVEPPRPRKPAARALTEPPQLFTVKPADAIALAFGLSADTAADRAAGAAHPAPELALAANRVLWPATWGKYFTDPMSWAGDGAALLPPDDFDFLRQWFADYVRADGPLPVLRVGRQPYGLLPVSTLERSQGALTRDRMENILLDIFAMWSDADAVPVLDPDASDLVPAEDEAAEPASDVGELYGATPHIHQLRLRAVDDTWRELKDLYDLRLGIVGLLCAMVPKEDGSYVTADELENHPWYQVFQEHEAGAQGNRGVQGQLDALGAITEDLDEPISGTPQQELAAFSIIKYIDRFARHHREDDGWPADDTFPTGDLLGIVARHSGRVEGAQPYLAELGARDELGADRAPRLYSGAFGEEGSETSVGVLVAPESDTAGWLADLRNRVRRRENGEPPEEHSFDAPASLLHHLFESAAATVKHGEQSAALRQGLDRLAGFLEAEADAAYPVLEWLLRGVLGLAMYRVDAWLTSLASERLAACRFKRSSGLQVGGYGWLVNLQPRKGKPSQGYIPAPSLDHATTAAVLRSGWSAFGASQANSPLAVDLSSERIRAARTLIEGVRSGQELGRLLGARFERRLHDRNLDRYIDDVRLKVLAGSGQEGRPPSRIVDGLLLARAYSKGVAQTPAEKAVFQAVDPVVSSAAGVRRSVDETVADLDAVADVLFAQSVHGLLRGDAGVAAPTLAATGSGDSGLPAIEFPDTARGGRTITLRVVAIFAETVPSGGWPGSASSILAVAEPRLEAWVATLLGPPDRAVVDIRAGGAVHRVDFAALKFGALDAVYAVDQLGDSILQQTSYGADAAIVPARPSDLRDDQLGFDEFVSLARSVRALLGSIRPLSNLDFETSPDASENWNLADLNARVSAAAALLPPADPRLEKLAKHIEKYPAPDARQLIERVRVVAGEALPVLPLVPTGVPAPAAQSFEARRNASDAKAAMPAWLAQAGKVRPAVASLLAAVETAELVQDRPLLSFAQAQSPDAPGAPWVGVGAPSREESHLAWCAITGSPSAGPVAGLVVDSWTEAIPDRRGPAGIAVHFDRPSAMAPNAVLLVVTRAGRSFDLDYVFRCVRDTLKLAQFRAMGPDKEHAFLGQFLPAVFLPGDTAILEAEQEDQA
jgi:hypothetical protein